MAFVLCGSISRPDNPDGPPGESNRGTLLPAVASEVPFQ
jgi:hypothetical protein